MASVHGLSDVELAQELNRFIQIFGDVQLAAETAAKSGVSPSKMEAAFKILKQMPGVSVADRKAVMEAETTQAIRAAESKSSIKVKEKQQLLEIERLAKGPAQLLPVEQQVLNEQMARFERDIRKMSPAEAQNRLSAMRDLGTRTPGGVFAVSDLEGKYNINLENRKIGTKDAVGRMIGVPKGQPLPQEAASVIENAITTKGFASTQDKAQAVRAVEIARTQSTVTQALGELAKAQGPVSGTLGAITGGTQKAAANEALTALSQRIASGDVRAISEAPGIIKSAQATAGKGVARGKLAGAGGLGLGLALLLPALLGKKEEPGMPPLAQLQLLQTMSGLQNQQDLTASTVSQRGAEADLAGAKAMMLRLQAMQAMSGGQSGSFL